MVVDMRTSKNQSFGHVAVLSMTLRFIVNICAVNVDSEPDSDLKSVYSDCVASTSSLSFFSSDQARLFEVGEFFSGMVDLGWD